MSKVSLWQKWQDRETNEEGQSLVIIAFVLIGILAFVGIAVDVGFIFARGSQLQAAVDAAALAGVTELIDDINAADIKAGQFLNANRIPISGTQRTATFLSSEGMSELGATRYTVTVTWPIELFFLRVLGFDDINLTRSATAATFFLTDIYASRRVEEGTVGTSTQGIFGPNICVDFGDPFSPLNSPYAPGVYTYQYRILIPPDFFSSEDVLRVELFDPDSINSATNSAFVAHTRATQLAPGNLPPGANKTCGPDGGRSEQKHPCVLRTDELALTHTAPYSETYQLDNVNPFWFVRVDENRGAGSPPGNGSCSEPGSYNTGYNTQTLYELYYYQQSSDGNPVRVPLAAYTGQVGDNVRDSGDHNTDLRWVSPGGAVAPGDTFVPADPSPGGSFELNLANDLPGILTEPGSNNRYIYLDITAVSGSSENAFEIWAGPNDYVGVVPSEVNARNVYVRNNPGSHHSRGVAVFALTNLPMNAIYGNSTSRPGEVDRPVDIPLIYVGQEYAGSSILVGTFDSDSGARSPITFYFDSLSREDWSMTFSVAGQEDPDGVPAGTRCIIGSNCSSQWVNPPYEIKVPGDVDNCDLSNTDWEYRRDNCTPFYGGRLIARYIAGETDTYAWQVQLTGLPYLER